MEKIKFAHIAIVLLFIGTVWDYFKGVTPTDMFVCKLVLLFIWVDVIEIKGIFDRAVKEKLKT